MEAEGNSETDFHVEGGEPGRTRAARLREAMRGNTAKALSEKSGVPFGTVQRYLSGGEMKLSNAVTIAQATGVRLEWLATGEGPMRDGEQLQAPPPAPAQQLRLFGKVKIDRLVDAYEGALASTRGVDRRLTMHLTVVLYDQLTEAAEATEKTGDLANDPQRHPQKAPQG